MQYVRNLSDSVSTAWNSINPATLSGAIDVIVVEQEDGTLMCSPFHVRFGKFSLLRPYEKKVEFKVNGVRQDYSMKLGEGGEAFFVFETAENIPLSMQTSPISSPASSPSLGPQTPSQEPSLLALDMETGKPRSATLTSRARPAGIMHSSTTQQKNGEELATQPSGHPVTAVTDRKPLTTAPGLLTPLSASPEIFTNRPKSGDWSTLTQRAHSDDLVRQSVRRPSVTDGSQRAGSVDREKDNGSPKQSERSHSPPPLAAAEAIERAYTLSKELESVNIPSRVTDSGDLMLDMTGFKNSEEEAIRAEVLARRVLSKELQGNYDVGALFGMDEQGNLWIYSSEEAKEAAMRRIMGSSAMSRNPAVAIDAASDPGYHSDDSSASAPQISSHRRSESDVGQSDQTPPSSPGLVAAVGDPNRNYAKTLRLTSDQLKALKLNPGQNTMSFTVNRATCSAFMYLWRHEIPVVISDIDGTITKSDALGHVLNMIGRDWTHAGVAKLYSDIVANGYNIMYLTSRSVGLADGTRTYLNGITQGGYKLPRGPTILSPDRTMAALRREIYLRKPEVFKMATLRDIRNLYGAESHPFYAGFGNRLTDQISYRTVDVPRNRIFTINANAEVSLDLLSLNQLKLTYVNITEVVDHYFPPVSTLVKGGGEEFTDFRYWRDEPLEFDEFTDSESDDDNKAKHAYRGRTKFDSKRASQYAEEEEEEEEEEDDDDDEEDEDYDDDDDDEDEELEDDLDDDEELDDNGMGSSYISHNSMDDYGEGSVLSGDYEGDGEDAGGDFVRQSVEEELAADALLAAKAKAESEEPTKLLSPPEEPSRSDSTTSEDVDAEVITGVKNLVFDRPPSAAGQADKAAEQAVEQAEQAE